MKHLNEEELVMLYYGEEESADRREHLADCDTCRAAFEALEAALNGVDVPVPERGDDYADTVWARLRPKLEPAPQTPSFWQSLFTARRWAAAAAMAALVIAAFIAGRFWPSHTPSPERAGAPKIRERILLVAVGDHLERSQMVLLELVNAEPQHKTIDISEQRERAQDLIASNRLYRQTAARAGDPGVAGVLDDLERVLLEVAHSPSRLSSQEFEDLRQRVEAQGILFKVRVIDSQLKRETRRSS